MEAIMFGWLKRRAQIKFARMMIEDIERFNAGLRGISNEEMGAILAQAYHWMHALEREFGRDLENPDLTAAAHPEAAITVNRLIREMQKRNQSLAPGLMVWLHSLRASDVPEVREHGRAMWGQLLRGEPHVVSGADSFRTFGMALDISARGRRPTNLVAHSTR
jgi:hypothetical protein